MGASVFFDSGTGKTAKEAFNAVVEDARYESGHGGYTGTIAEKDSFKVLSDKVYESYQEAADYAESLIDEDDARVSDKWGPAGCLKFKSKNSGEVSYLFFGWASS
jgi:hypothetical protein